LPVIGDPREQALKAAEAGILNFHEAGKVLALQESQPDR
jgi:hypothetical protein